MASTSALPSIGFRTYAGGACIEASDLHAKLVVARQNDHWKRNATVPEPLLKLQPAHLQHLQVEYDAVWHGRLQCFEKFVPGFVGIRIQIRGPEKATQCHSATQ